MTRIILDGLDVEHIPEFAPKGLFETVRRELSWESHTIRTPGGPRSVPRLLAWVGDLPYTYSNIRHDPCSWPATIQTLRDSLATTLNQDFNGCLANLYRDRHDSISKHADDEPEIVPESTIASLSLGGMRRFKIRHLEQKKTFTFELGDGDLLVMRGKTQFVSVHWIDKEKTLCEPRINLTFRLMR